MIKRYFTAFALLPLFPLFASADTIFLKNGMRIDVKETWEEDGQIKCVMFGAVVGYPKEDVERIVKENNLEDSAPYSETSQVTKPLQKKKTGPITFKEKIFYPLKWGMSVDLFKSHYPSAVDVTKSLPASYGNYSKNYFQDLGLPFYGHISNIGFRFDQHGLDHIVVSYLFRTKGNRLYQPDILRISKQILQKLIKAYGKPTRSYPWNGQTFNYMWFGEITYVQFAWDGGNGWGVQFRSIEIDPQMKTLIKLLKEAS